MREIIDPVVRMARENAHRGYSRIRDALANLLKRHVFLPAPERGERTAWRTFPRSHWDVLAAVDLFTVEVWGLRGLGTVYDRIVIELSSRRVHFAGTTPGPNEASCRDRPGGMLRYSHRHVA